MEHILLHIELLLNMDPRESLPLGSAKIIFEKFCSWRTFDLLFDQLANGIDALEYFDLSKLSLQPLFGPKMLYYSHSGSHEVILG